MKRGKAGRILTWLELVPATDPENVVLNACAAYTALELRDPARAIEHIAVALRHAPENPNYQWTHDTAVAMQSRQRAQPTIG
jgi:predicted Zn-dependent protease